jgi:hypothetical protein
VEDISGKPESYRMWDRIWTKTTQYRHTRDEDMVLFWEMGAKRPYLAPLITYLRFKGVGNGCMLRHGWRPFFPYTYIVIYDTIFALGDTLEGLVYSPFWNLKEQLVC